MKAWKPTLPPFRKNKPKVFENSSIVSSFIYQIGESPILRKPSKEVPVKQITSQEMKAKIKYFKNCLIKYRKLTGFGRGITAVQVGIPERFAVIYTKQPKPGKKFSENVSFKDLMVIINPKINKKSIEKLSEVIQNWQDCEKDHQTSHCSARIPQIASLIGSATILAVTQPKTKPPMWAKKATPPKSAVAVTMAAVPEKS